MSRVIITPYAALADSIRRHRPSHVLTVMSDLLVERPEGIAPGRHLQVRVDDINIPDPDFAAPSRDHVANILDFAHDWDRKDPFLVHCWAGISRSTAAAYVVLNDVHGSGYEQEIAHLLRLHAPHARPNRLIVQHADALLRRGGRMVKAVEAMGPGIALAEGEVVELPITLDGL